MSFAWEVTEEDVAVVLTRHGRTDDPGHVLQEHFAGDSENCARVERSVLAYTDFDEQIESALGEIESILIEAGVIPSS